MATIQILPDETSPPPKSPPPGGTTTDTTTDTNTGGGGSDTPDWVKKQEAERKKAERRAAQKYSQAAKRLAEQAEALRIALSKNGYRKRLSQQLANVTLQFKEQDALILEGYARGRKELKRQAGTNEDALATGTSQALGNAGRERAEALAQVVSQGAGLSDSLRAQAASLRNWEFNQSEVQAGYIDTLNSLNSAESEMVNMVKAQRQGAWRQREEQRAALWTNYYDQRSRTLTDIGNQLGEAASYWGMANEAQESDFRAAQEKRLQRQSNKAFRKAARQTGRSYAEKATPGRLTSWSGQGEFESDLDNRRFGATPEFETGEAEGATLRRWEA